MLMMAFALEWSTLGDAAGLVEAVGLLLPWEQQWLSVAGGGDVDVTSSLGDTWSGTGVGGGVLLRL